MGANPEMIHIIIIRQYPESNHYKYVPSSKGKHTWTEQENVLKRQREFLMEKKIGKESKMTENMKTLCAVVWAPG